MDITRFMEEEERDLLLLVQEAYGAFGMIKQYRNPLKKGDTVRIVGDVCQGLVGELKVIDPEQEDECFFGVALDAIEGWIFFSAEEIERLYSPAEIQANLAQFFQDVGLYLLKESLYGRVPGLEIKVNMAELPF